MAELSSPLQVTGLIETNCASDTGIYSIYRFTSEDYGREYIGYAFFYSAANDMDSKWFKNVRLLWENGTTTAHGLQFLKEDWTLDYQNRVYRNIKNETIEFGYGPFDKNGEKIDLPEISDSESEEEEIEVSKPSEDDIQGARSVREIDPGSEAVNDLNKLEALICDQIQSIDTLYGLAMEEGTHPHAKALILPKIKNREQLINLAMNKCIELDIRESILSKIDNIDQLKSVAKKNKELKKFIKSRIKLLKKR